MSVFSCVKIYHGYYSLYLIIFLSYLYTIRAGYESFFVYKAFLLLYKIIVIHFPDIPSSFSYYILKS